MRDLVVQRAAVRGGLQLVVEGEREAPELDGLEHLARAEHLHLVAPPTFMSNSAMVAAKR
jgi:hypothetical protein